MGILLTLAFLFFMGSLIGWIIELFFRRFISSANPERKWINPGFCTGPYLPLYGFGLCFLFLISSITLFDRIPNVIVRDIVVLLSLAIAMTVLEYLAGIVSLKFLKVRLWNYSDEWGNIQGIICPKFSFFWAVLGAIYYFFIHPHILNSLHWLSHNLAFSFFVGVFFGIFIIDVIHSSELLVKLKKFAEDNDVIVRYENLKSHIRSGQDKAKQKYHFFKPFQTKRTLHELLSEHVHSFEERKHKNKILHQVKRQDKQSPSSRDGSDSSSD